MITIERSRVDTRASVRRGSYHEFARLPSAIGLAVPQIRLRRTERDTVECSRTELVRCIPGAPWLNTAMKRRKLVVIITCGVGVLAGAGVLWHRYGGCLWRLRPEPSQPLYLRDLSKGPLDPPLPRGKYKLDIVGQCYRVHCDLEVVQDPTEIYVGRDSYLGTCSGDPVNFVHQLAGGTLESILLPAGVRHLNVRIMQGWTTLYDGPVTSGNECKGSGLCVFH